MVECAEKHKRKVEHQLKLLTRIANRMGSLEVLEFDLESCSQFDFSILKKRTNVIYFIQIINYGSARSAEKFCNSMKDLKGKVTFKLPQVNLHPKRKDILYIGKSTGLFKNRMEQHIISKSDATYSLHLDQWNQFPNEFGGMRFKLHFAEIRFADLNIMEDTDILLEMLETSLHENYRPLLGRADH